jgi:hypothetical protein
MDESEKGIAIDASNQQNCFFGENASDDSIEVFHREIDQ